MFVDPSIFESGGLPPVVIIGSGPAGLSLALSLAEREIPSLILEAGDTEFDPDIQDDFIGEISADPYLPLDVARLRQFGGASNHWVGWCRPLDASDFEPLPDLGIPGWPITKADLDPYAARTREILEIPEHTDHPLGDDIHEAHFVFSPPVNFRIKYTDRVRTSPYLNVALRTAVTALHSEDGRIAGVDIVDAAGTARRLTPDFVVVAGGGIENSRLLLWSNEVSAEPVVAEADTLGRYWMEHPHDIVGEIDLTEEVHVNPLRDNRFVLSPDPERLAEHGALNASIRMRYHWDRPGIGEQVKRRLCATDPSLLELGNTLTGSEGTCGMPILAVWEQAPDFENRVELSETLRDSFGNPQANLIWRKTEQDYRTVRVAFEMVAAHIVRRGAGKVRADPHLIEMGNYPEGGLIGGAHHMGGTRMSDDPADGIVDRDLKIHGLENAYVAGSSVFVRGGHANPTYTIVQLSLRLADHLAARVSG